MSIKNYRFRVIHLQTIVRSSLRLFQSHPSTLSTRRYPRLQRLPDTPSSNIDSLPVLVSHRSKVSISSHPTNHPSSKSLSSLPHCSRPIQESKLLTTRYRRSQKSILSQFILIHQEPRFQVIHRIAYCPGPRQVVSQVVSQVYPRAPNSCDTVVTIPLTSISAPCSTSS